MKTSASRLAALGAGLIGTAAVAQAHPGHEGHEFTWDFEHLAAHPIATILCVMVIGAAVWGGWTAVRRFQTLRGSQARRGK